jgi:dolichol kinase
VELARWRSARARERVLRATGLLLRAHEHQRLSGATWLLASFALAVALYPRAVAVAAMWGVAVGDASAAVVGRLAARRRANRAGAAHRAATTPHTSDVPTTPAVTRAEPAGVTAGKTFAGSAACFVATLAGALAVARLGAGESVVAALAGALAERPARPFDDNVRIVAAVGVAVLLYRLSISAATP